MYDISGNYDIYGEILDNTIHKCCFFLCLLVVGAVGIVFLLRWWYKSINEDEETSESSEEFQSAINERIAMIFASVVISFAIIGGCIATVKDLLEGLYDKNNNAYIVVDEVFAIKSKQGIGLWVNESVYTLVYEQDGETIEVDVDIDCCDLEEGRYTDKIIVYSAHSNIVVDVIENADKR